MGVAQSNPQRMWNTTASNYMFYGELIYSCSRNANNDTYTVTVTGLRAHGRDWNFPVYYSINLGGVVASGNIGKTNNPKGELWVPTNGGYYPLNVSCTVNGVNGYCPPIYLYFRVYNDSVSYINAGGIKVSFSSEYNANISGVVQSESGGPNWSVCGGASVNRIIDNGNNTFTVQTTMGNDGINNYVSNVHIYYSFTNSNAQAGGSDCYGRSDGVVNGRTVTFYNIPFDRSGTVYVGAHSISSRGTNIRGAVQSSYLTYYGAPTIDYLKCEPTSTTTGKLSIRAKDTAYNFRVSKSAFATNTSSSLVSWSGNYSKGIIATHEGGIKGNNEIATFYTQVRRANIPDKVSAVKSVTLDLRLPIISASITNVYYEGIGKCKGKLNIQVTNVSDSKLTWTLAPKNSTENPQSGTISSPYNVTRDVTLLPDTNTTYVLTIKRKYDFLQNSIDIPVDTRYAKVSSDGIIFESSIPTKITSEDSVAGLSDRVGALTLRCNIINQSTGKPTAEWDTCKVTILDRTARPQIGYDFVIQNSAEGNYINHMFRGLNINHRYELVELRVRYKGTENWSSNQVNNQAIARIKGTLCRYNSTSKEWKQMIPRIYSSGNFKQAVAYVYKDKTWHLVDGIKESMEVSE